jgi:hypothetical protein
MATILDAVTWKPVSKPDGDSELPYATHEGVLRIGAHELRCYRLNTGQDIIHAEDFEKFFGAIEQP